MVVIGLTGNIGSGKSTVAAYLKELGAYVIDADQVAREVVEPGGLAYNAVKESFGVDYFDDQGQLLRRKLGEKVFGDESSLLLLESIVQPAIRQVVCDFIAEKKAVSPDKMIVVEAALFVEAGWFDVVDELWLVKAKRDICSERVVKRDGLSRDVALQRYDCQMDPRKKEAYAQRIFLNDATLEKLFSQVREAYQQAINYNSKNN